MTGPLRQILRRLLLVPLTVLGVTLVTFALVHLAPGDPALVRAGASRGVTAEVIAENRALAGLDRPLVARYLAWVRKSAALDFGLSPVDGRPARARVAEALPRTAALALLALLLSFGLAIPLGVLAAARAGTRAAAALDTALLVAYAVPAVATGMALLRAGAPWGGGGIGLLAPAVCLAFPSVVTLSRQQRGALLRALGSEFMRTARAKGASFPSALVHHALRNALLPMVTLAGTQLPVLLSGSVVVERIFGVHGLGLLGYDAVLGRDYPTLMALTTLAALATVAGALLADGASLAIDPRLRDGRRLRENA